jgi:hypothetical protein
MISLVTDTDFGAARFSRLARVQEQQAPLVFPVTLVQVTRKRKERRALRLARQVLRGIILTGSLTAAWQIGAVIGHM